MQSFGCILILTICVFSAHSLPNSIKTRTADDCYDTFSTTESSIDTQLENQTEICQQPSNQAASVTAVAVNGISADLQSSLASCAAMSDSDAFNCYVSGYDSNLKNLNSLTQQSRFAAASLSGSATEMTTTQQNCIMTAIMDAKSQSLMAYSMLENCLDNLV